MMAGNEINFILDKQLKNLNEEVEKLVYNLNNPLAGKKIHIVKTFTKELMRAYAQRMPHKITKNSTEEAFVISKTEENYGLPKSALPIMNNAGAFQSLQGYSHQNKKIQEEMLNLSPRAPSVKKINEKIEIKQKKRPQKIEFKPGPIPEERINLITSKITGEEMAYAIKKGLFYIVNETDLAIDEITILNNMKPYLQKNNSLFQDKNKFVKLMKRIARKNKIDSENLSPSKMRYFLIKHILNFGLIDPILYDPFVTEITCEGANTKIRLTRQGKELITNLEYKSQAQLDEFIQYLAKRKGKLFSEQNPSIYLEFEDFTVNATCGIGDNPSIFTLKKFI